MKVRTVRVQYDGTVRRKWSRRELEILDGLGCALG